MKYLLSFVFTVIVLDVAGPCGIRGNHHDEPDPKYYLSVSPTTSIVLEDQQGSKGVITVSSNTQWNIDTDCDWLEVDPSSGKGDAVITVTALTLNESIYARAGIITISSNYTQKKQIRIHQEGKAPTDN